LSHAIDVRGIYRVTSLVTWVISSQCAL